MTNRIALFLGIVVIGAILADVAANDSKALVFTGKQFFSLIEYLAFWR